jgi:hypoxia-inducible factor (prolyl hydroxylase)
VAATSLSRSGYAVVDGLVGSAAGVRQLHEQVRSLPQEGGRLAWERGAVGGGETGAVLSRVRGDRFLEVSGRDDDDSGSCCDFVPALVARFDALLLAVSRQVPALKGVDLTLRSRPMLACYPAGKNARYIRHVDNPDGNGRVVTCIYYLNADWAPADGGQLRLHPAATAGAVGAAGTTVDVDPIADRLVLFWSDARMPHEVLPALNRDRWALSVWYMDCAAVVSKAQQAEGEGEEWEREREQDQGEEADEEAQQRTFAYLHAVQLAASRAFLGGFAVVPKFCDGDACAALAGAEGRGGAAWGGTECGQAQVHWCSAGAPSCYGPGAPLAEFEAKAAHLHYQLGTASQPALEASAQSDTMVLSVQSSPPAAASGGGSGGGGNGGGNGAVRARLPKLMYSTYVMLCCVGGDDASEGGGNGATIDVHRMRGSAARETVAQAALKVGDMVVVETTRRVHLQLEVAAGRSCTFLGRWFFKPDDMTTPRNAGKSAAAVVSGLQHEYGSKIILV